MPEVDSVCDLSSDATRAHWMPRIQLEDIWGVGPASAARLRAMGCTSVADLRDLDPRPVRKGMTVVGERLIYELRGMNCLDLETVVPTRKGCAVTRSFSSRVTELAQLEQAVATYAARLAEKLRRAGLGTDHVTVFIHTSEHDHDRPQRSCNVTVDLPEATSDTVLLTKAARWGARRVWRDGFAYSKAGLITNDLVPLAGSQRALLGIGQFNREHSSALMAAMDQCNKRWGRGTVVLAAAGFQKNRTWSTKFEMRSPRYTTSITELPLIG
jgi:DNA polymerase V